MKADVHIGQPKANRAFVVFLRPLYVAVLHLKLEHARRDSIS